MKRITSILVIVSMLTAFGVDIRTVSAQSTASAPGYTEDVPQQAVIGSTAERQSAWDSMTPEQRDALIAHANAEAAAARQSGQLSAAQPMTSAAVSASLALMDSSGGYQYLAATKEYVGGSDKGTPHVTNATSGFNITATPPVKNPDCSRFSRNPDCDSDGLGDIFERSVADIFTPYYHVSADEPNQFARFEDRVPQTVKPPLLGSVPPVSHYRVKPLGIYTEVSTGREVSLLRVDYLTLLERDNGLDSGGDCAFGATVAGGLIGLSLSQTLDGLTGHDLDNERSAVLLAAPTASPGVINQNAQAYSLYKVFTSGHEGVPFTDQSRVYGLESPVLATAAKTHVNLWLSRSKHATYIFNPDDYPIIQRPYIFAAYNTVGFLYAFERIDYYQYLALLYTLDVTFFSCIAEAFSNQAGREGLATTRLNVGEPNMPITSFRFIQDTAPRSALFQKLTNPVFREE